MLAAILVIAAFFRLVGIRFGEPLAVHPGEKDLVVHAMQASGGIGNPGWFEEPSGMVYFTLLVEGLHYLASAAASPEQFWTEYKENPFPYHLWVRVSVALVGVLGVFAVWLLGREWDRGRTSMRFLGWGGAALLSFHFLHLRDSHFATGDVPVTTAITFALWLLLREFHRDQTNIRRLMLVAISIGFCCGIRYSAGALIIPLLYVGFADAVKDEKTVISPAWLVGSGSLLLVFVLVGFLMTTPYAVLDAGRFWLEKRNWFFSRAHTPIYGGGHTFLLGYIEGPWVWGGGMGLACFSFFGLMMAVLRHEPEDKVLLAFSLPYMLLISAQSELWGRRFLPLVPIQALWAVRFIAVYAVHPWALQLAGAVTRQAVAAGLVALIGIESAIPSLRLLSLLRETDSRVEAQALLSESLESWDKILTTPFCPPLPSGVEKRNEDKLLNDSRGHGASGLYDPFIPPLDTVREDGVTAVVYSSFYWEAAAQPFVGKAYPNSKSYRTFAKDLEREGDPDFEVIATLDNLPFDPEEIYAPTFHLWQRKRPGPNIILYRLPAP